MCFESQDPRARGAKVPERSSFAPRIAGGRRCLPATIGVSSATGVRGGFGDFHWQKTGARKARSRGSYRASLLCRLTFFLRSGYLACNRCRRYVLPGRVCPALQTARPIGVSPRRRGSRVTAARTTGSRASITLGDVVGTVCLPASASGLMSYTKRRSVCGVAWSHPYRDRGGAGEFFVLFRACP